MQDGAPASQTATFSDVKLWGDWIGPVACLIVGGYMLHRSADWIWGGAIGLLCVAVAAWQLLVAPVTLTVAPDGVTIGRVFLWLKWDKRYSAGELSEPVIETTYGKRGPSYCCRVWLPSGRRITVARGASREPIAEVRERLGAALAAAATAQE